jgi:hypothetical protein
MLLLACIVMTARPATKPLVSLAVGPDARSVVVQVDGRAVARWTDAALLTVLHSPESDIWNAQSWIELQPEGVRVSAGASAVAVTAESFGGQPIRCRAVGRVVGREVRWDVTIANRSGGTVVGVVGPGLRGIADIEGGSLYIPDRPGQRLPDPWTALAGERRSIAYPVPASMQYVTYAGRETGLALHVLDRAMAFKHFAFGGPARELTAYQYPFIAPGQHRKLPTVVWQTLEGDWHPAADRYRAWFDAWAAKPRVSPQVMAYPIMGGTVVRSRPVDDPHLKDVTKAMETGTYAGALEQARQLKAGGFDGTELVGWFGQGHDTTYPDHWPSEAMGGTDGLKQTLRTMREIGMISVLYLNARLAAVESPTLALHPEWEVRQEGGKRWVEQYGDGRFVVLCPSAPGWRAHLREEVLRAVREYGTDGVQLDQIGAASSMLCFNRDHGHTTPATAWGEGYPAFLRDLQSAARRIAPHYWQWVEGAWEGSGQYLDGTQGGFWQSIPGTVTFPQLYRYTHPGHPLFTDARMGGIPYWCPSNIHRNRRINEAVGEFFHEARFLDDIGLRAPEGIEVHWFRKGKRAVLTVFNASGTAEPVAVTIAGAHIPAGAPRATRAIVLDEAITPEPVTDGLALRVRVPAREVEAVLIEW